MAMNLQQDSDRRIRNLAAVIVLGGLFSVVGTLFFAGLILLPTWQMLGTLNWQPVSCTITHAQVANQPGQSSDLYSVDLRYTYTFKDQEYHSDRYSLSRLRTSDRSRWQTIVDAYPVGSTHTCLVNPTRPTSATLRRFTFGWHMLIPLPFMLVGYSVLYAAKTGRIKVGLHGRPDDWRPRALIEGRKPVPIVLSPRKRRIKHFIKIALAAIVFNGINAMIIQQGLRGGTLDTIQAAFVLIVSSFGIVGIVFFYKSVRALVRIFSPAIKLELENGLIPLGDSVWLRCHLPDKPGQVSQLALRLFAKEHIFHPRSSGTRRDSKLIFEQAIAIQRDEAMITIPVDAMHSSDAEFKKVIWMLEVSAEVAGWPDIKDRYPITVIPAPVYDEATSAPQS